MKQGTKAKAARKRKPANVATADLSMRRERFIQEYLADPEHNATAAYMRAGYTGTGQAARTAAARLLRHPEVKAAIAAERERVARKFEVTRERVLAEYAKLAFLDPRKFFREDGTLKHPTELDDGTAAGLHQFEIEEEYGEETPAVEMEGQPHGGALKRQHAKTLAIGRTAKIKWSDKKAALDSIVKMMGYAKDESALGTAENPLTMIVRDMNGRQSALVPAAQFVDDGDDE